MAKLTFLLLLPILSFICISVTAQPINPGDLVMTWCTNTTFPKECTEALTSHAADIHTPEDVAHFALLACSSRLEDMKADMVKMISLRTKESGGHLEKLLDQINKGLSGLKKTLEELNKMGHDHDLSHKNRIKTSVNAVLRGLDSCLEKSRGHSFGENMSEAHITKLAHLVEDVSQIIENLAELYRQPTPIQI